MRKVLVIGSSGSGKSTFSRQLGEITGLRVVHLDRLYWSAGWVERPRDVWLAKLAEVLKGDSWIIDGNYGRTMEMRLGVCDTVVYLDLPRLICTARVIKRTVEYRADTRPDMAPDCPERFDWEFLKWTWNYSTHSRPEVEKRLKRAPGRIKVHRFTTSRAAKQFLSRLESPGSLA